MGIKRFLEMVLYAMPRVGLIRRGKRWGTGFLVGDDLLLTNQHVLEKGTLGEYEVIFDYTEDTANIDSLPSARITSTLQVSPKEELDYQLVRLDKSIGGERGFFGLYRGDFTIGQKLALFGFPNIEGKLQPMQFLPGEIATFISQPKFKRIGYSAETRSGSSGSPVLSLGGEVLGLHHWGEKGAQNFGVPVSAILADQSKAMQALVRIDSNDGTTKGFESAENVDVAMKIDVPRSAKGSSNLQVKERLELLKRLGSLRETQFNQLIVLFDGLRPLYDRCSATVGEDGAVAPRVNRLFAWFDTPQRPPLVVLVEVLDTLGY